MQARSDSKTGTTVWGESGRLLKVFSKLSSSMLPVKISLLAVPLQGLDNSPQSFVDGSGDTVLLT